MSVIKRWLTTSSPRVKLLMGISLVTGIYVINKGFIVPYVKRKKYKEAEAWANMIIEQEENGNGEENNNISY